ncbi:LLM class flavin-dependent oxidoreductase, partial [Burkholderia sp. Ac-20353]|uniref:LLM class flavin-dependent oxidoreductase n=1 Tax=Burkholderia sp. Ac-20353 TaxID=2703894 RepID=UPI00197B4F44
MSAPRLLLRLFTRCDDARPDPAADWIAIAEAGIAAGCDAVLLPADPVGPDPWMAAAALVDALPDLRVVVSLQAGAILPVAAAHLAQSLQSLSRGRALLACEADARGVDASGQHAHLNRDQRLARSAEFLSILAALWATRTPLRHRGTYFRVDHAQLPDLTLQRPPVYWCIGDRRELAWVAPFCDGAIVRASASRAATRSEG